MRKHFYQKNWFKNTILISIPTLISVIGLVISVVNISIIKNTLIIFSVFLMVGLIFAVIFFSNQEDAIYEECEKLRDETLKLATILAHMENEHKTNIFTISVFSEWFEKWAKTINSFANNVKNNGFVSDKAWDNIRLFDSVCTQCKNMIKQYCNIDDNSKISVSFVSYKIDSDGEKWVHMVSHSDLVSVRPSACKEEQKLSECHYHYADLIKEGCSDIEVAINNEEILQIFRKTSLKTDRSKYTQYISIPIYCTNQKLLGIFQVVTKYGVIIEKDRVKLLQFATNNLMPYSNLIVLIDKINKGLYISPSQINKES